MSKVNTYNFATYSYPVVCNATPGVTASGSTIELISVYVPPNLFRPGETIELSFMISDSSSASSGQKICYWTAGTSSFSSTQSVFVAQWSSTTSSAGTQPVLRYLHIAASDVTYTSATSSQYNITQISNTEGASAEQTNPLVSLNIDWTVSGYFFVRGGVTGDRGQYIYLNRK